MRHYTKWRYILILLTCLPACGRSSLSHYIFDKAPHLAEINDQYNALENVPILPIDANDISGTDLTADGTPIIYQCNYSINNNQTTRLSCNGLNTQDNFSHDNSNGIVTWTPDDNQAGLYYFTITGQANGFADTETFIIQVSDANSDTLPPDSLQLTTVDNQIASEGSAITMIDVDDISGGDTTSNGQSITYGCTYDQTLDDSVASGTNCSLLNIDGNFTFNSNNGQMSWIPDYHQAGSYEFLIRGNASGLDDETLFTIIVNDTPQLLVLQTISDQTVQEQVSITTIDANGQGGTDYDADGNSLTYQCYYDQLVDSSVSNDSTCDEISISPPVFSTTTGIMDWTPAFGSQGAYEFKITANNGTQSDSVLFTITVQEDTRPSGLALNETKIVSMGYDGNPANGISNGSTVAVSATGRYIVYTSEATNLVPHDTEGFADTFMTDILTGDTMRVSQNAAGVGGNDNSDGSAIGSNISGIGISDDGNTIVFISSANNLISGGVDTNSNVDVYAYQRDSQTMTLVSVSETGTEASDGDCQRAQTNSNGRYVVFQSLGNNLVAIDNDGYNQCYRYDLWTNTTILISIAADNINAGNNTCYHPRISSDGNLIAFTSNATNLVASDLNGSTLDSFVRDVNAGTTTIISKNQDGSQCSGGTVPNQSAWSPTFSGNQEYVTFHGYLDCFTDIVDTNNAEDIFRYRMSDGYIMRVSEGDAGQQSDARSYVSRQDNSGRFVSFNSLATNLITGQPINNGYLDVFVKDIQTEGIYYISQAYGGGNGNGTSDRAYINLDGTHVVFESEASNLVADDTNGNKDIFIHRFR